MNKVELHITLSGDGDGLIEVISVDREDLDRCDVDELAASRLDLPMGTWVGAVEVVEESR